MQDHNVHRVDRKLENALRRLRANRRLPKAVKETLERFTQELAAQGLSLYRQLFYLTHLVPFAETLKDAFLDPSADELKALVADLERTSLADWTKTNKRTALKRFYKWLLGEDAEYPPCVRWLRTRSGGHRRTLPEDLLTEDELEALVRAAVNPRDKALIALLGDGGLRIGEALSLRVKDLVEDRYGGVLTVPRGKTGARRVRLVESVPVLRAWVRGHPRREEPDAPLFCYLTHQVGATRKKDPKGPEETLRGHREGEPLTYPAARSAIQKAAGRARIPRAKVNPHAFRHLVATRLAKDVPEAPLEQQLGWVPGSQMSRIYVHLSGRDVDEAILKAKGVRLREGAAPERRDRECARCEAINPPESRFCHRCGLALTRETAEAVDALEERLWEAVLNLARDPVRGQRLRELLRD